MCAGGLLCVPVAAYFTPVPLKVIACGFTMALSLTKSVPALLPAVVGVKVMLIVHDEPTAKRMPQLWVAANGPVVVMAAIAMGNPPEL